MDLKRLSLVRRALYGLNASVRLSESVLGGKTLEESLAPERAYYAAHKQSLERLTASNKAVEAAKELYGPVVSWNAHVRSTSRPHHAAADGKNFSADAIPAQTGSLPGEEPNCECFVGPKIPGARMLR